jgi:ubiquitin-like protein ATG12
MRASNEATKDIDESDVLIKNDNDDADRAIINTTTATNLIAMTTIGRNSSDHQVQRNDVPSHVPDKVKIHFVAVGSAPILKRTKFQINADQRFAAVHVFLRRLLKLPSSDENHSDNNNNNNNISGSANSNNLFLYCCSAFVPSPDHLVGELRDSFANAHTKELVIHYSLQEAWG